MTNKKKSYKKSAKKNMKKMSDFWKKVSRHETHFMFILILFAFFSLYAITSFFSSTNDYLDKTYVSVVRNQGEDKNVVEILEAVEPYEIFGDVLSDHGNALAIEALRDEGVVGGFQDGNFKPDDYITRATAIAIITNALDADFSEEGYTNCFKDVNLEWYEPHICYAKEHGWTNGYSDGRYLPNDNLTKAEALKLILTAMEYSIPDVLEESPYSDVEIDSWYGPYAYLGKEYGIINRGDSFNAGYTLTRSDFVKMVYNAMKQKGLIE